MFEKYITKLNTLFFNLKDKCQISQGSIVAKKLRKSSYLAVSTQNQHIGKRPLSYLRNLTVLMIMSNAFSGIFFPGYLCREVLGLEKCQSALFSVGAIFHLNTLEQDFH